jgi:hypothetical protein
MSPVTGLTDPGWSVDAAQAPIAPVARSHPEVRVRTNCCRIGVRDDAHPADGPCRESTDGRASLRERAARPSSPPALRSAHNLNVTSACKSQGKLA